MKKNKQKSAPIKLTNEQKIAVARMLINREAPYYSVLMEHVVYRWSTSIPTMAMSKNGVCYMHKCFVDILEPDGIAFCLLHEVAGHYWRVHFNRKPMDADNYIWNVAGDLEINDSLIESGWTPPSKNGKMLGLSCDLFNYPKGKTAEFYFSLLTQQYTKEQLQDKLGHSEIGMGTGKCGSAADNDETGEDGNTDGRSDAEVTRIRKETAQKIKDHAQKHGNIPDNILREVDLILKSPKVSWKEKFARYVKNTLNFSPGLMMKTFKKFGRRQAAVGYSYGSPIIPSTRNVIPNVIFAVDTSASMGVDELTRALTEANGILKNFNSTISFMSFDAEVAAFTSVSNINEMKNSLKGGGGTDFRPIFDKLAKERIKPDLLVIATDGYGPTYDVNPIPKTTVIWLLIGKNSTKPCAWGEAITIEEV